MELPSGNDLRMTGSTELAGVGDQQTGTNLSPPKQPLKKSDKRPVIRVGGKVYKGEPGESYRDIISKIPDGVHVSPEDLTYESRADALISLLLNEAGDGPTVPTGPRTKVANRKRNTDSRKSGSIGQVKKPEPVVLQPSANPTARLTPRSNFQNPDAQSSSNQERTAQGPTGAVTFKTVSRVGQK